MRNKGMALGLLVTEQSQVVPDVPQGIRKSKNVIGSAAEKPFSERLHLDAATIHFRQHFF